MVSKVIVTPESVRGLGNIVSEKSTVDFITYDCSLSLLDGVYTMVYDGDVVLLTVSSQRVPSGGSVVVTASLTDVDGEPITGVSVELFKEV